MSHFGTGVPWTFCIPLDCVYNKEMRVPNPLILSLALTGSLLLSSAQADTPAGNLNAYKFSCDGGDDSDICPQEYKAGYCQAFKNAVGCSDIAVTKGRRLTTDVNANTVHQVVTEMSASYANGSKCCSTSKECSPPDADSLKAAKNLDASTLHSFFASSEAATADATTRLAANTAYAAYGLAGACAGYREACLLQGSWVKNLVLDDTNPDKKTAADLEHKCNQLDDKAALKTARTNLENTIQAIRIKAAVTGDGGDSGLMDSMLGREAMMMATTVGMAKLNQALYPNSDPMQSPQANPIPTVDCSNPAMVGGGCAPQSNLTTTNKPWNNATGAGFNGSDTAKGATNFNPANVADSVGGAQPNLASGQPGAPWTTNGVANGGGGGLMGGSGGSGSASLGGAGPSAAAAGRNLEIMRGVSGGGGYSPGAASMSTAPANTGGWSGYGREAANEKTDWSQFLPGHAKDPNRHPAGLDGDGPTRIYSKDVNIWNRITDHMRARCSQGLLRDCVP